MPVQKKAGNLLNTPHKSQLEASSVSDHTEELWYKKTVSL